MFGSAKVKRGPLFPDRFEICSSLPPRKDPDNTSFNPTRNTACQPSSRRRRRADVILPSSPDGRRQRHVAR
ncbi:hypothetical protein [Lysobacter gummosus]|uniref:hypothetical protein n=1 Tax=Lysobacter gummosus TaxID=262324 RepID=UPI00363D18F6